MDQQVRMCNIERKTNQQLFVSQDLVAKINFLPLDDNVFLSCHYDGKVRMTDLRLPAGARTSVLVRMRAVGCASDTASAISFNPIDASQFVLCGGDESLRIFDTRRLPSPHYVRRLHAAELANARGESVNASGVAWGPNNLIAVTWQYNPAMIFDLKQIDDTMPTTGETSSIAPPNMSVPSVSNYLPEKPTSTRVFKQLHGHDNRQTFLKEIAFFNEKYVATGSDDGELYLWSVDGDGTPIQAVKGDNSVVNGVDPHPYRPAIAVCGIDSEAKIIAVGSEETADDESIAEMTLQNRRSNQVNRERAARFFMQYASRLMQRMRAEEQANTNTTTTATATDTTNANTSDATDDTNTDDNDDDADDDADASDSNSEGRIVLTLEELLAIAAHWQRQQESSEAGDNDDTEGSVSANASTEQ